MQYSACVQIPVSEWEPEQLETAGIWAIFANGKYYAMTEYWKDGGNIRVFDPGVGNKNAPMVKGTDSLIWAGDYYDIVYIRYADFMKKVERFGTSPLETGESFKQNTAWDLATLGEHLYDPDTKSKFLGEVGFGERIELKIKLEQTQYLSPSFGTAKQGGSYHYYDDFSYSPKQMTARYSIDQAADFELSMGFGGERSDWFHIVKDLNNSDPYKPKSCGMTIDYVAQLFTICVELPTQHAYVDPSMSLVKLYIRPSLNSAYRRTIWPYRFSDVRKMQGELASPAEVGEYSLHLKNRIGEIDVGDVLYMSGDSFPYAIVSVDELGDGSCLVHISSSVRKAAVPTTLAYTSAKLTSPELRLSVDEGFYSDWNGEAVNGFQDGDWLMEQHLPMLTGDTVSCSASPFHVADCLGFHPDRNAVNWLGSANYGVAHWNSYTDAGNFKSFLSGGLFRLSTTTDYGYRLESLIKDSRFSEAVGSVQYSRPIILSHAGRALILWKRDTAIIGRWMDIATGEPFSSEVQLNTAPVTGRLVARSHNNNAVIVWESNAKAFMLVKDLLTGIDAGAEVQVATRSVVGSTPWVFDVAVGDAYAMLVWNASDEISMLNLNFDLRTNPYPYLYRHNGFFYGRRVDLNSGAMVGSVLTLYSNSSPWAVSPPPPVYCDLVTLGGSGYASLVWNEYRSDADVHNLRVRSFRLSDGASIGTVQSLSQGSGRLAWMSGVSNGEQTVLFWKGADNRLLGRGFGSAIGSLVGVVNFEMDSNVGSIELGSANGMGLLTYTVGNGIFFKAVDIDAAIPYHANRVDLSTSPAVSRMPGLATASDNTIFAVWEQSNGSISTIRGRTVNATTFAPIGNGDFMVSTENRGDQIGAAAIATGTQASVFWLANDVDQSRIRKITFDLINPGSLRFGLNNFFVAPLIERDYTIQARIKY